jgi:nitronate monooxygenase
VPPGAGDALPPDFGAQFDAVLAARPAVMCPRSCGPAHNAAAGTASGSGRSAWWATVGAVAEARAAVAAGADVVVAPGRRSRPPPGCLRRHACARRGRGPDRAAAGRGRRRAGARGGGRRRGRRARTAAAALACSAPARCRPAARCCAARGRHRPGLAAGAGPVRARGHAARAGLQRPLRGRALATPYVQAAAAPEAPSPRRCRLQRGLTTATAKAAEVAG